MDRLKNSSNEASPAPSDVVVVVDMEDDDDDEDDEDEGGGGGKDEEDKGEGDDPPLKTPRRRLHQFRRIPANSVDSPPSSSLLSSSEETTTTRTSSSISAAGPKAVAAMGSPTSAAAAAAAASVGAVATTPCKKQQSRSKDGGASEGDDGEDEEDDEDDLEDEEDEDDEDGDGSDDDDDELDFETYYSFNDDLDVGNGMDFGGPLGCGRGGGGNVFNNNDDPEYFAYECLSIELAEKILNDLVSSVCSTTRVAPSEAKLLLHLNQWSAQEVIKQVLHHQPSDGMRSILLSTLISPSSTTPLSAASPPVSSQQSPPSAAAAASAGSSLPSSSSSGTMAVHTGDHHSAPARSLQHQQQQQQCIYCEVCAVVQPVTCFSHLACKHLFCKGCWELHFECQVMQGISTSLSCMSANCDSLAHEEFVLSHITKDTMRNRYKQLAFCDYIRSHPQLRFCPGNNCKYLIKADKCIHKRATCDSCKTSFCYQCGGDYHAPTDCETIKRWLTKCADDSETANYISAHTKDCPKCNICIEKNGGCNHMQCYNCKHDFCWMCLGDWKTHGSEYYECSRYKENPNIAHESAHAQAREALKKYLHYFERWENHSKSMKLEAQTLAKIRSRINDKVMNNCGTWIDWQYLLDAAALLAKCRYTLQYTYPYAYYMEPSSRKELFECQQAQLEAEIENLSWKIEHAEITDRGDLENQIDVAEKRRTSLLKDFLPS